jgi:predicted O-linked N-acetylglucosamine transferase (SPINDLY family)
MTQPPPLPAEVDALIALYNGRRYAEAESRTRALLEQHPEAGFLWKLLGASQQMQGKDALPTFQKTAQLLPDDAEAHYNLGVVLKSSGQLDVAAASYRRAVALQPDYAEAHSNLGNTLKDLGRLDEAVASYRRALKIKPDSADAHNNLGTALKDLGRLDEAVASYRKAVALQPDFALAYYNLGNALKELGQLDDAVTSYRRAIEIKPDFADAHNNLGTALKDLGQFDAALSSYRRVLELRPGFAEAHNNLGVALKDLGQLDAALASYRKAVELKPNYAEAHNNLGTVLQTLGQPDAALACYRRAVELQPQVLQHAIYAHLLLPVIPETPASIAEWRERYQNGIAALMNIPGTLDEPGDKLGSTSFYLAYHNENDRPVMEALCRLFRARVPNLTATAPHVPGWRPPTERGQRIRVGFLSEFLGDHTIGKHYQGFIRHLDRNRFEVVVIHGAKSRRDTFRQNLDALADKVLTLPAGLKNQQQAVAAEQLDVLFYPDIGMAPSTYFLAYARLAPVQATSWGHPDTTGLDTMDYYVSAVTNEPEQAEAYYTERLIRLNRLPCFYYQTLVSSIPKLSKAALGLPETGTLYGCPQNLFKLHPDFDAVLAAIAAGDPAGHLILPEGKHSAWTELLKARWAKTFPNLAERVVFLPRMSWDRFMAVMAQMDVLLDPLHFGSGNTLYDAMVNGTPVVTWPGRFARGRNVAAAYRQMGVADAPIARHLEDYAPLALALGSDTERRRALRVASLAAAGRELFEDIQAVREFESFLEAAVAAAGRGELLPPGWQPDIQTEQT